MNIRVAIIEDEPATSRHLKNLLQEAEPGITVLEILNSVSSSIEWLKINSGNCDLLLMDIQLTDGISFEIFDHIQVHIPVIFITAYNDYALKAFKANGIDYILKPFDSDELSKSITRFKNIYYHYQPLNTQDFYNVLQQIKSQSGFKKSFLVHYRNKLIPLNTIDIQWLYSENETVHAAITTGANYIIEGTLEKLQQQLDPSIFFRANRQFIVNRSAIQEVDFYFNGRLLLKVQPVAKENILISKARVPEFKEWMNS